MTGVDDDALDGDQTSTVTAAVNDAASDDSFDGLSQAITVTVTDDDIGITNATPSSITAESAVSGGEIDVESGEWEDIAVSVDHDSVPGKTVIEIELTEGGPFDTDTDPTTLTDPGGPGYYRTSEIPSVNQWGAMLICFLPVLSGLNAYSRKALKG